jgi:AraC family transcriptional regulator, regulatory protein of adaptative response / methylated-DNA-[protein]-cysteine methyltransferase
MNNHGPEAVPTQLTKTKGTSFAREVFTSNFWMSGLAMLKYTPASFRVKQVDGMAFYPDANLVANEAAVYRDLAKVIRFVEKPAGGLYLPLDLRGTPFQRCVWEKLRAIPVGRTVTYTNVAYWVGPLTSARAVADACASNRIALAVPCHRVVRSNGDLASYRWGVERKREIIRREAMA